MFELYFVCLFACWWCMKGNLTLFVVVVVVVVWWIYSFIFWLENKIDSVAILIEKFYYEYDFCLILNLFSNEEI